MYVKKYTTAGCLFLGKGLVGRPEMGVIVESKTVVFDEKDVFGDWKGIEESHILYRTDNGFVFSDDDLISGRLEVEAYAPNWRSLDEYCIWMQHK